MIESNVHDTPLEREVFYFNKTNMVKEDIKQKLRELKKQLNTLINSIQIERKESKDDETNVLDELMMNKSMLEQEIDNLQTAISDNDTYPTKQYVLIQNGNLKKIKLVKEALADSTNGLISLDSPLGKALKKVRVGEKFAINTPIGKTEYILKSIE